MDYILLIVWFFILIKCASYLVNWSTNIAKKFWISNLVIWLTIVALWTSAPEIFINTISAFKNETWLALWNIIWSNIANILLILWISSIIYPLKAKNSTVFKEVPFIFITSLALFFLAYDKILWKSQENILTLWDSLVLILFFVIFMSYTFWIMENLEEEQEEHFEKLPMWKSIVFIVWWIIWLSLWAKVIVDSSINIASHFGV
jgi:cation:H+ antiporter